MKVEDQQLKSFLLDADLVKAKQFDQALKRAKETKQKVGDVLVSEGFLSREELIKLEAYILGIPFVNLEKEKRNVGKGDNGFRCMQGKRT